MENIIDKEIYELVTKNEDNFNMAYDIYNRYKIIEKKLIHSFFENINAAINLEFTYYSIDSRFYLNKKHTILKKFIYYIEMIDEKELVLGVYLDYDDSYYKKTYKEIYNTIKGIYDYKLNEYELFIDNEKNIDFYKTIMDFENKKSLIDILPQKIKTTYHNIEVIMNRFINLTQEELKNIENSYL